MEAEVQERSQKSSKKIGEAGDLSWVGFKGGYQDQGASPSLLGRSARVNP